MKSPRISLIDSRLLLAGLLAFIGTISASHAATLIGRYSFENDIGSSIYNDAISSADAVNGSGTGADSFDSTLVDLPSNNYRSFDGRSDGTLSTGDYINQPNFIGGLGSYSIAAWFQTTGTGAITIAGGANTYALSVNDNGGGTGRIGTGGGQIRFSQNTSGWDTAIYSNVTTVNNGGWHFVTVTYDGAAVRMYVDGTLQTNVNSTATGSITTGNEEYIAAYAAGNAGKWSGNLDDVRYYNGALTGSEVTTIYTTTSALYAVPETRTVALLALAALGLLVFRRRGLLSSRAENIPSLSSLVSA